MCVSGKQLFENKEIDDTVDDNGIGYGVVKEEYVMIEWFQNNEDYI